MNGASQFRGLGSCRSGEVGRLFVLFRSIAATLVFALVFGSVSHCAAVDREIPLRIVTFNSEFLSAPRVSQGEIQHFQSDYGRTQHLERVAHLIETLNPDVLNLVEVTSKEAVDAIVKILHEKGLTDYRGYHIESNETYTGLDVAVTTKLPMDEVEGKLIRTFFSKGGDPT